MHGQKYYIVISNYPPRLGNPLGEGFEGVGSEDDLAEFIDKLRDR